MEKEANQISEPKSTAKEIRETNDIKKSKKTTAADYLDSNNNSDEEHHIEKSKNGNCKKNKEAESSPAKEQSNFESLIFFERLRDITL